MKVREINWLVIGIAIFILSFCGLVYIFLYKHGIIEEICFWISSLSSGNSF